MTVLRVCDTAGAACDEKSYFDSAADLQRCMTDPRMGQALGDVPNYFTGETDVLVGETVG